MVFRKGELFWQEVKKVLEHTGMQKSWRPGTSTVIIDKKKVCEGHQRKPCLLNFISVCTKNARMQVYDPHVF